jgi:NAD(P)H-dependent FMN reductase
MAPTGRTGRVSARLARYLVDAFTARGALPELIDAKAIGLPMLDRMYKEHPPGSTPAMLEDLAQKIRAADAFVFVTGECNWGVQPGLKNLTDHFTSRSVTVARRWNGAGAQPR